MHSGAFFISLLIRALTRYNYHICIGKRKYYDDIILKKRKRSLGTYSVFRMNRILNKILTMHSFGTRSVSSIRIAEELHNSMGRLYCGAVY